MFSRVEASSKAVMYSIRRPTRRIVQGYPPDASIAFITNRPMRACHIRIGMDKNKNEVAENCANCRMLFLYKNLKKRFHGIGKHSCFRYARFYCLQYAAFYVSTAPPQRSSNHSRRCKKNIHRRAKATNCRWPPSEKTPDRKRLTNQFEKRSVSKTTHASGLDPDTPV